MATTKILAMREDQKVEALKLFMVGTPYTVIAAQLGVSLATAWRRVQAAVDDMRPHADFEKYRAVQLAELEVSRRVLRRIIASYGTNRAEPVPVILNAITTLLKLQEREAKLLGLDRAPTPIDELLGLSDEQLEVMMLEWAAEARQ